MERCRRAKDAPVSPPFCPLPSAPEQDGGLTTAGEESEAGDDADGEEDEEEEEETSASEAESGSVHSKASVGGGGLASSHARLAVAPLLPPLGN